MLLDERLERPDLVAKRSKGFWLRRIGNFSCACYHLGLKRSSSGCFFDACLEWCQLRGNPSSFTGLIWSSFGSLSCVVAVATGALPLMQCCCRLVPCCFHMLLVL